MSRASEYAKACEAASDAGEDVTAQCPSFTLPGYHAPIAYVSVLGELRSKNAWIPPSFVAAYIAWLTDTFTEREA